MACIPALSEDYILIMILIYLFKMTEICKLGLET